MENIMNIKNQIKSVYPNLTKTEKKVADYTLQNMDVVFDQTLTQISKLSNVGEATIMRFIYKLGFDSFAQFKLEIVKNNLKKEENVDVTNLSERYAKKIYELMTETIKDNHDDELKKVAKMIDNASHVYFCGNGTSGYSAEVAFYRFFRAGVSCEAITDVHLMKMKSVFMKKNDLVVAISLSGDNIDLNDSIKKAKEKGCSIITISGHKLNFLSNYGDINLYHAPISLNEKSYYGGILGIIIQEFLVDLIFHQYERLNPEIVDNYHKETTVATNMEHESLKNGFPD